MVDFPVAVKLDLDNWHTMRCLECTAFVFSSDDFFCPFCGDRSNREKMKCQICGKTKFSPPDQNNGTVDIFCASCGYNQINNRSARDTDDPFIDIGGES